MRLGRFGTPPSLRDVDGLGVLTRWCRSCLAQPPANHCEPSGFGNGEPDRSPEGTLQRKPRASETSPWRTGSKLISPFFLSVPARGVRAGTERKKGEGGVAVYPG